MCDRAIYQFVGTSTQARGAYTLCQQLADGVLKDGTIRKDDARQRPMAAPSAETTPTPSRG
jgi:hypothetical protein